MVISKNKVYEASGSLTFEYMLESAKKALQSMGSKEITTQNLDKSFIRYVGKFPTSSQFGNQITIAVYQEGSKYFVQLKAENLEAEQFWTKFETYILGQSSAHVVNSESPSSPSNSLFNQGFQLVNKLCEYIRNMGSLIDEETAWDFITNYQIAMQQLPTDMEIPEIASEYIKLIQQTQQNAENTPDVGLDLSLNPEVVQIGVDTPQIQITAQDALRQMLREIPTLEPETLESFFALMNKLELEDQQKLINKVRQVETDLNKVPYLLTEERLSLRNEVLELPTEKRRAKLLKMIKERQKNEPYYMVRYSEQQIKQKLKELPFLRSGDVDDIMSVILTLSFDEKKKIVEVVKEIENEFDQMVKQGVELTPITRKNLRLDLIRLNDKERMAEYEKIAENSRSEHVKGILFEAIPNLRYEKHDTIVKELIWLNDDELRRRIKTIKANIDKEAEEKTKEFEKSKSATACKKCGWPMGSFSKKCPRCGYAVDDWFKL